MRGRGRRRGAGLGLRLRAALVAPSPRTCHWNRRAFAVPRLAGWREGVCVGAVKGERVRGSLRGENWECACSSARAPGGGARGGGRGRGAPAEVTCPRGGASGGRPRPV